MRHEEVEGPWCGIKKWGYSVGAWRSSVTKLGRGEVKSTFCGMEKRTQLQVREDHLYWTREVDRSGREIEK